MARTRHRQLRAPAARVPAILGLAWLALAAMVAQVVVPMLHGPHGGPVWERGTVIAAGATAQPGAQNPSHCSAHDRSLVAITLADHDCSTCPICQSIQVGGRPSLPTPARIVLIPAQVSWSLPPAIECIPVFRLDAASGPRGPPLEC